MRASWISLGEQLLEGALGPLGDGPGGLKDPVDLGPAQGMDLGILPIELHFLDWILAGVESPVDGLVKHPAEELEVAVDRGLGLALLLELHPELLDVVGGDV